MTPSVAIISTSINPGDQTAYANWTRQGDLIVAGDLTSHPSLASHVTDVGGRYLTPESQYELASTLSDVVGWYSIQRRNLALLLALRDGYDYVVSVDDDNHPPPTFVKQHVAVVRDGVPSTTPRVVSPTGWVNSAAFVEPPTVQRGTSSARLTDVYRYHHSIDVRPVVSQAHVIGDPDVGAATRIIDEPRVVGVRSNVVVRPADDQWLAFNSQATVWDGRWAHYAAVLPGVGRYDDIFGSFVLEAALRHQADLGVHVGTPEVTQLRNDHDVRRDLRHELVGMELTLPVIEELSRPIEHDDPTDYGTWAHALVDVVPEATTRFMLAWADEIGKLTRDTM